MGVSGGSVELEGADPKGRGLAGDTRQWLFD
jgi:hypothetical protein